MNKKRLLFCVAVVLPMLSGCYVEPGHGTTIAFDGHPSEVNGTFVMDGQVRLSGGIPARDVYRNVSIELHSENGTLLYEETLGDLHNKSDRLPVSISLSTVPTYVIIDSPDIWNGQEEVDYYVYAQEAHQNYHIITVDRQDELPITIDT